MKTNDTKNTQSFISRNKTQRNVKDVGFDEAKKSLNKQVYQSTRPLRICVKQLVTCYAAEVEPRSCNESGVADGCGLTFLCVVLEQSFYKNFKFPSSRMCIAVA